MSAEKGVPGSAETITDAFLESLDLSARAKPLLVSHLPSEFEADVVLPIFAPFGRIVALDMDQDRCQSEKGCALLTYASTASAEDCIEQLDAKLQLTGAELPLSVAWASDDILEALGLTEAPETDTQTMDTAQGNAESNGEDANSAQDGDDKPAQDDASAPRPPKLFLGKIPNAMRDAAVSKLISPFGNITNTAVIVQPNGRSKGYGFVTMADLDQCRNVVRHLHGVILPGAKRPIIVRLADSPEERQRKQAKRQALKASKAAAQAAQTAKTAKGGDTAPSSASSRRRNRRARAARNKHDRAAAQAPYATRRPPRAPFNAASPNMVPLHHRRRGPGPGPPPFHSPPPPPQPYAPYYAPPAPQYAYPPAPSGYAPPPASSAGAYAPPPAPVAPTATVPTTTTYAAAPPSSAPYPPPATTTYAPPPPAGYAPPPAGAYAPPPAAGSFPTTYPPPPSFAYPPTGGSGYAAAGGGYTPAGGAAGAGGDTGTTTSLFVKNLPRDFDDHQLHNMFAPFGTVVRCNVPRGKKYGFVTYANAHEAQSAIGQLNGQQIGSDRLSITFKK